MGKSKSKTTNDPWQPAQPYLLKGLQNTQNVFDQQQPNLNKMSGIAQDAYNQIAPSAFGTNAMVQNAQDAASKFASGQYLGSNPGSSTYQSIMGNNSDPSLSTLGTLSQGSTSPGNYDGIGTYNPANRLLGQIGKTGTTGATNAATGQLTNVSNGGYLNSQPSAGLYNNILSSDYLDKSNPYLDSIVASTNGDTAKAVNQRFAAAGQGSGLSTALGDVMSKNLANNEGQLRYTDYDNRANRQLTAAGQSDSVWSGERNRQDAATGLINSNFNANQDRALSAATGLGSLFNQTGALNLQAQQAKDSSFQADRANQLAAAQALGSQYGNDQSRALDAAKSADTSQQGQYAQMLQALGLTGDLRSAQYAGVQPALSLLDESATIPWVGVNAYNGGVRTNSAGYGTSTTTQSQGVGGLLGGIAGAGLAGWASGGFKGA